jgi:hypothetical protein
LKDVKQNNHNLREENFQLGEDGKYKKFNMLVQMNYDISHYRLVGLWCLTLLSTIFSYIVEGATSGAGTAYPSGIPEFTPDF